MWEGRKQIRNIFLERSIW